jgi:hypothetical protein
MSVLDEWPDDGGRAGAQRVEQGGGVRGVLGHRDEGRRRRPVGVARSEHPDHPAGDVRGHGLEPRSEHPRVDQQRGLARAGVRPRDGRAVDRHLFHWSVPQSA